jgi:hypothetical protein
MCQYQVTLTKGVVQICNKVVNVADEVIASRQVGATDLILLNSDEESYEFSGLDRLREAVRVKVEKHE